MADPSMLKKSCPSEVNEGEFLLENFEWKFYWLSFTGEFVTEEVLLEKFYSKILN